MAGKIDASLVRPGLRVVRSFEPIDANAGVSNKEKAAAPVASRAARRIK